MDHMDIETLGPDRSPVRSTAVPVDADPMVLDLSRIPAVVLVVEDEMMLRMRAVNMVEDAGYTPVEAWMPTKLSQSWNPSPTSRSCAPTFSCRAVWTA